MFVRLTPQSTFGTAQARCTAAAVPMLDSAILAATLILRPSLLAQLAGGECFAEAAELDQLE